MVGRIQGRMMKPTNAELKATLAMKAGQRARAGADKLPEAASGHRTLAELLVAVRNCGAGGAPLPLGPRPILSAQASARILIVGQAPGVRVHTTGIPWNDASGERLRAWMGVDSAAF